MEIEIEKVKDYWDSHPCNVRHSPREIGSREYFDEVEKRKYFVEPHIPQFAQFEKWEGKNVLDLAKQILRALNYLTNSLISNIIETRLFILSKNRNYEQKRNNLARNFISSH